MAASATAAAKILTFIEFSRLLAAGLARAAGLRCGGMIAF
jgi:hypothetical protein